MMMQNNQSMARSEDFRREDQEREDRREEIRERDTQDREERRERVDKARREDQGGRGETRKSLCVTTKSRDLFFYYVITLIVVCDAVYLQPPSPIQLIDAFKLLLRKCELKLVSDTSLYLHPSAV
jgi:hypothetical protein